MRCILQTTTSTGFTAVKRVLKPGCPTCGHGATADTPESFQYFYDNLFGPGTFSFRYGDTTEVTK